jgi:hypothetical protein
MWDTSYALHPRIKLTLPIGGVEERIAHLRSLQVPPALTMVSCDVTCLLWHTIRYWYSRPNGMMDDPEWTLT